MVFLLCMNIKKFKITRGSENSQFEKIHNAMPLGWQLSDYKFVNTT